MELVESNTLQLEQEKHVYLMQIASPQTQIPLLDADVVYLQQDWNIVILKEEMIYGWMRQQL